MKSLFNLVKNIWNKGFFHVLFANVLFAFVAFGSQLLVAKFLTDQELGYIKIFQSVTQIFAIIAGIGFSTSVLVLCANPINEQRKTEILQISLYCVMPISIIIWILFLLGSYFDLMSKIIEVKQMFYQYSFIIIIIAITAIFTSFFQANREFKKYAGILLVTKIISLVLIVLFTYFFGFIGFMNGLWIGLIISLLVNLYFIINIFNIKFEKKIKNFFVKSKEQFNIGIYGLGANLFGNLGIHLDIILIGFFYSNNPKLIGQYGFATIFIIGLGMIQGTIVQVASPFFSKYVNNKEVLINLFNRYSVLLVFITVFIFCLSLLLLPILIEVYYNDKFLIGIGFLKLLLIVWFTRCLNSINIAYFTAMDKTKLISHISLISLIIMTILLIISLKYFDINYMIYSMIFVGLCTYLFSIYYIKKNDYL